MAKTNPILKAETRKISGKGVKKLRQEGILPATIYGHGMEAKSIQMVDKEMEAIFNQTGESGLVDLMIDGEKFPILFRNPQYHPLWGKLIHIDCYKVNLKEKITTNIPLEFIGESPAVKEGKVLIEVIDEIEVEALPTDLPEKIEVDLTKLETVDSQITVADLAVDRSKVEITNAADQVVVKVEEPKVEEEPVAEETVAPGEVPATEQKTPEEKAQSEAKSEDKDKKEEK